MYSNTELFGFHFHSRQVIATGSALTMDDLRVYVFLKIEELSIRKESQPRPSEWWISVLPATDATNQVESWVNDR